MCLQGENWLTRATALSASWEFKGCVADISKYWPAPTFNRITAPWSNSGFETWNPFKETSYGSCVKTNHPYIIFGICSHQEKLATFLRPEANPDYPSSKLSEFLQQITMTIRTQELGTISARVLINQSVRAYDLGILLVLGVSGMMV